MNEPGFGYHTDVVTDQDPRKPAPEIPPGGPAEEPQPEVPPEYSPAQPSEEPQPEVPPGYNPEHPMEVPPDETQHTIA